jgi:hypothetical protein
MNFQSCSEAHLVELCQKLSVSLLTQYETERQLKIQGRLKLESEDLLKNDLSRLLSEKEVIGRTTGDSLMLQTYSFLRITGVETRQRRNRAISSITRETF